MKRRAGDDLVMFSNPTQLQWTDCWCRLVNIDASYLEVLVSNWDQRLTYLIRVFVFFLTFVTFKQKITMLARQLKHSLHNTFSTLKM
jgi:hypothetical protein